MSRMITLCITMGQRPDLLRQTLQSLAGLPTLPALAINDFADDESNEVFTQFYPDGRIVGPGHNIGHHPAIDELYQYVETPLIFHIEDDWQFERVDFLNEAAELLSADPSISSVCVRDSADMALCPEDRARIYTQNRNDVEYQRLDHLHDQWHGYSFNPHVSRLATWQELGGFSQFKKERHVSRYLRKRGYYMAYLSPPACRHIGDDRSTHLKPPTMLKRIKTRLRS